MRFRWGLVTAVLLSTVATLVPLAYAAPPDPTWIGGFWDDADHDDVVSFITSDSSTIEPRCVPDSTHSAAVVEILPHSDDRPARFPADSSPPTRAPPLF